MELPLQSSYGSRMFLYPSAFPVVERVDVSSLQPGLQMSCLAQNDLRPVNCKFQSKVHGHTVHNVDM
jgi:hypothetical protein